MSDQAKTNRGLSEIGHLFLSSVRARQTNGAPLPKRQPPRSAAVAAAEAEPAAVDSTPDITPEEFAQVLADDGESRPLDEPARIVPVTAIISSHLNGGQLQAVKSYARQLAAGGLRVGLILVDGSEFRLMCFDCPPQGAAESQEDVPAVVDYFDPRSMTAAINELNWDLDHWLLMVPNIRTSEARGLLRAAAQWVVLCTGDSDGVLGAYRTLKGLHELPQPRLSLAVIDAADEAAAAKTWRKLAGVCQQFLGWTLEQDLLVRDVPEACEHEVMCCRPMRDKAQSAHGTQWKVVGDFLAAAQTSSGEEQKNDNAQKPVAPVVTPAAAPAAVVAPVVAPVIAPVIAPVVENPADDADDAQEVIELADAGEEAIIGAVLRMRAGELIECPVRPPMCPQARLVVSRDHGLTLLAACRQGLGDLRAIGHAYRWLIENRALVAMAMPQFAIDAHQLPRLRLLVDHGDLAAGTLQPMLQNSAITLQAYRRLRWAGRNGLLLEAA